MINLITYRSDQGNSGRPLKNHFVRVKRILYVFTVAAGIASCGGNTNEQDPTSTPDSAGVTNNKENAADNTATEKAKAGPGDTTIGTAAGTSSGGAGTGASGSSTGASSGTGSVGSDTSRSASGTDTVATRSSRSMKKAKQKN